MKEVLASPLFGIVLSVFAFQIGLFVNKKPARRCAIHCLLQWR